LERKCRQEEQKKFEEQSQKSKEEAERKKAERLECDQKAAQERRDLEDQARKARDAEIAEIEKLDKARAQKLRDEQADIDKARDAVRKAQQAQADAENTAWGMDALRGLGKFFSGGAYKPAADKGKASAAIKSKEASDALADLQRNQDAGRSSDGKQDKELQFLKQMQKDAEMQQANQVKQIEATMESAKQLQQEAQDMEKQAYEASVEMIETNAKIQKLLCAVGDANSQASEVERVIQSLNICVETMGKIKVTFQKYKIFWAQMKVQTSTIADMHGDVKLVAKRELERVREIIYVSAQSWAAVGMLNSQAYNGMDEVLESSDAIMNSLPTSVNLGEIKALADILHAHSVKENKKLKECMVHIEEELKELVGGPQ